MPSRICPGPGLWPGRMDLLRNTLPLASTWVPILWLLQWLTSNTRRRWPAREYWYDCHCCLLNIVYALLVVFRWGVFFFLRRLFSSITKLRFRDWAVWTVRLIVEIKSPAQCGRSLRWWQKEFYGERDLFRVRLDRDIFFFQGGSVESSVIYHLYHGTSVIWGIFYWTQNSGTFEYFVSDIFFQGFLKIRKLINFRNANHPSEQNLLQFDEKNLMKRKFWARNFRKFGPNKKSAFS